MADAEMRLLQESAKERGEEEELLFACTARKRS